MAKQRKSGWCSGPVSKSNSAIIFFFSFLYFTAWGYFSTNSILIGALLREEKNILPLAFYCLHQFACFKLYLSLETYPFLYSPQNFSNFSSVKSPNRSPWKSPKKSNRGKNYTPNQFIHFIKANSLKYT